MLLAVFECGGFSPAGEKLHISHSAVHRQIRILEQELGTRILVRAGKRVQVTDAGTLLVELARRIQKDIAAVQGQINEGNQLRTGHLWIGTGTTILTFFLPAILERFRREYPGVDVRVVTSTADEIIHAVQAGKLDVGVVFSPQDMPTGEVAPTCELLYKEEVVLVVGSNHALARRRSVTLSDAIEFPFILYPKPSHIRRACDRLFAAAGLSPQVIMELENEEAIEKMLTINMGVGFLSRRRAMSGRIRIINLKGQRLILDAGLVFPTTSYLPPPVREFARMCRDAVRPRPTGQA